MLPKKLPFCLPKICSFCATRHQIRRPGDYFFRAMSWEPEKKKFLTMSMENKRKFYPDYIKWKDIPSWKKYAQENNNLSPKINLAPDHRIDSSKNSVLTDKVCILSGDITTLEVNILFHIFPNFLNLSLF